MNDFINGLLSELFQDSELPDLTECLQNRDKIFDQLTHSIKLFHKGNINDSMLAIKQLSVILEELPENLQSCSESKEPTKKILRWLGVLKDKQEFLELIRTNVKENYLHIAAGIQTIGRSYDAKNFKVVGKKTAEIMTLLLGPLEEKEEKSKEETEEKEQPKQKKVKKDKKHRKEESDEEEESEEEEEQQKKVKKDKKHKKEEAEEEEEEQEKKVKKDKKHNKVEEEEEKEETAQ